jgi:hypothetical protein
MPKGSMPCWIVVAALVATLIAAPAASAMPIDPQGAAVATYDMRGEAAASGGGTGVPVADTGDGAGVDVPVVLLIIAGTLAIGGGMAVATNRVDPRTAV